MCGLERDSIQRRRGHVVPNVALPGRAFLASAVRARALRPAVSPTPRLSIICVSYLVLLNALSSALRTALPPARAAGAVKARL